MKIKYLKVNGFGKLENKELIFKDGLNIVYGKNEAGKSTLLKFITSMFYGISKNKNGGTIPENEKYEPWYAKDFSGKIVYDLDDRSEYEVYRDFRKKNPQIFNSNSEDISKTFNIDKTKGINYLYEQVGIEENVFEKSIVTKQAEIVIEDKEQNELLQKISNILGTGEDTTSYTTVINKLKKKINDEVGTNNTKDKPINIIESKLKELYNEKEELKGYYNKKHENEDKLDRAEIELSKLEKELNKFKIANIQKEELKEYENKISINEEIIDRYNNEISNLENIKIDNMSKNSKSIYNIVVIIVLLILSIISIVFVRNNIFKFIPAVALLACFIIYILNNSKRKKKLYDEKQKQREIKGKINLLQQNIENQIQILNKIKDEYNNKIKNIDVENIDNILEQIDNMQKEITNESILINTLRMENKEINEALERDISVEEEIIQLEEEKKDLEYRKENLKRTLDYLQIAYNKMKEQVAPKFTEELTKTMVNISDGKYSNIKIGMDGDIIVEDQNGRYINTENLSIGTVDQLYFALRLATAKEISNENMPIILDETFAYFDDERLENILIFLKEEYSNKQFIILTCNNREKGILNKLKYDYNYILI